MQELAELIDRFPGLTRTQAALLLVLMRAQGRTLCHDYIMEQIEPLVSRDQSQRYTASEILRRLRPIIAPRGLTITTIYGIGMRLEKGRA